MGKTLTPSTVAGAAVHSYTTAFLWSAGFFTLGVIATAVIFRSGTLSELGAAQAEAQAEAAWQLSSG